MKITSMGSSGVVARRMVIQSDKQSDVGIQPVKAHRSGKPTAYSPACLILALVLIFFARSSYRGRGGDFTDEIIIKAIISEAIGESELGIIAVAHTFKTRLERGMTLGSVGYKRKDINEFIARQPKQKVQLVKDIWQGVKSGKIANPVVGVVYFENVKQFGKPDFVGELVMEIGNHQFFLERGNYENRF